VFASLNGAVGSVAQKALQEWFKKNGGWAPDLPEEVKKYLADLRARGGHTGDLTNAIARMIADLPASDFDVQLDDLPEEELGPEARDFYEMLRSLLSDTEKRQLDKDSRKMVGKWAGEPPAPTRKQETITPANSAALVFDDSGEHIAEVLRARRVSADRGDMAQVSRAVLGTLAEHYASVARGAEPRPFAECLQTSIDREEPCAEAEAKIGSARCAALAARIAAQIDSRCNDPARARSACSRSANNAAHHAEDQALVDLLWQLNGRAARIVIVSFGHGACTHCKNLFSLLGDVKKSRSVPAFLCPAGLDADDTGHWNGVYYIDLPAVA
jgi:hypothetical protein